MQYVIEVMRDDKWSVAHEGNDYTDYWATLGDLRRHASNGK